MDKQYINRKLNFVLSLATLVVRVQASFRLLWRTEVKWLQAALLGKTKVFFVADQCLFRIGVATDAIIPRRPPTLGGEFKECFLISNSR